MNALDAGKTFWQGFFTTGRKSIESLPVSAGDSLDLAQEEDVDDGSYMNVLVVIGEVVFYDG